MNLQEIKASIAGLTSEEFAEFSNWFDDYSAKQAEEDAWDAQIAADAAAGKFDGMMKQAMEEVAAGRYTEL